MKKTKDLAILILAAGTSSRLGKPKQLLKLNGEILLSLAIKKALEFSSDVTVVLGHNKDILTNEIIELPVSIVVNPNYMDGMGTSIACGISNLKAFQKVLIMLCDQPLIPKIHYEKLIAKSNEDKNIIVCSNYQNRFAVPAIFPKKHFNVLEKLEGDKGARGLLKKNPFESIFLSDNYSIDIDTEKDYIEVKKEHLQK